MRKIAMAAALLVALAGCSSGAETTTPRTTAPPTSSPASPAVTLGTHRPGEATFASTIHGISIDYPSGWQIRPATEPWNHDKVTFGSADADVIFDPAFRDDLYIALVSEPLDGQAAEDWCCSEPLTASAVCSGGSGMGAYSLGDAGGWILDCGGTARDAADTGDRVVVVATATRGYIVQVHLGNRQLIRTYDGDWFEAMLETVDLLP